jgi:uncharacterized protein (TIGR02300 family)
MPDLGKKYECAECGTKFYDLGKSDRPCPRCGSNQRAALEREKAPPVPRVRAVPVPVVEEPEEELVDDVVEEDEEILEVVPGEEEEEEEEDDEV